MYQDFMSEILALIRLCKFLFKMKLEQPENLQGGVIEGPFLAAWLHSPIYARQTAQMNAQLWVEESDEHFQFLSET